MKYQQVLYEVSDRVATITLNRPEALNAWTDVMAEEVWHAMHEAERDDAVRVIVLTGAGRAFCAGGDVTGFKGQHDGDFPRSLLTKLARPYDFSRRPDYQSRAAYFPAIDRPIIAMLNGATAGLGLVHALFADIRIAADDAVVTTAFARIGLASEYGMAWALRNVVGPAAAAELLLSARKVRGEELLRVGLASQLHPHERLAEATYAYARELATACSPRSLRVMKRQLWNLPFQSLHEALIADSEEMLRANLSEDFQEGKLAFKEKRPPRFTGR
ncbi:enoyl-CoA hydratase-related protein [Piscinibacter sp. XHJ-5]|uniref:enoyl-CoA hydratase-related protein n=1 Tax=Piscinibacter sp. XHJ-5 TaxID=3037797 RepID=UPI0024529CF7|nr:enoyl-CoA hydratase-related protein [Piscinibacter sp. XHJ-5]